MAYDSRRDKEVAAYDVGEIRVTIHSYNDKEPKVQISRAYVSKSGETNFTKSGRLSKEEWEDMCAIKQQVLDGINDWRSEEDTMTEAENLKKGKKAAS